MAKKDEFDPLERSLVECLKTTAWPLDVAAVGGSHATGHADEASDLDLFLFCEDRHLAAAIDGLKRWAISMLGPDTIIQGPLLRDEFGVGFRFFRDANVTFEAFLMSDSMWRPAPAHGHCRIIYKNGEAGEHWARRIDGCRNGRIDQNSCLLEYLHREMLVHANKVIKHLRRREELPAAWYCQQALRGLIAAENYAADPTHAFEPFTILKRLAPHETAAARLDMRRAVEDPASSLNTILERIVKVLEATPNADRVLPAFRQALASMPSTREINRRHWEEVSSMHAESDFYAVDKVRRGEITLTATERNELGNIGGLDGIHIQCGIGLDTLSLTRLGATMCGMDFASAALQTARNLAAECSLEVTFIRGDFLQREDLPGRQFDFAYASHGVLRWIDDIERWARHAHELVRPGGFLYLFEIHPLVYRMERCVDSTVVLDGDYLDTGARVKERSATHIGSIDSLSNKTLAHFDWPVSEVLNALIRAGFAIELFNEHRGCSYSRKRMLRPASDGLWYPPFDGFPIPLSFSIRGRKRSA